MSRWNVRNFSLYNQPLTAQEKYVILKLSKVFFGNEHVLYWRWQPASHSANSVQFRSQQSVWRGEGGFPAERRMPFSAHLIQVILSASGINIISFGSNSCRVLFVLFKSSDRETWRVILVSVSWHILYRITAHPRGAFISVRDWTPTETNLLSLTTWKRWESSRLR